MGDLYDEMGEKDSPISVLRKEESIEEWATVLRRCRQNSKWATRAKIFLGSIGFRAVNVASGGSYFARYISKTFDIVMDCRRDLDGREFGIAAGLENRPTPPTTRRTLRYAISIVSERSYSCRGMRSGFPVLREHYTMNQSHALLGRRDSSFTLKIRIVKISLIWAQIAV